MKGRAGTLPNIYLWPEKHAKLKVGTNEGSDLHCFRIMCNCFFFLIVGFCISLCIVGK